MPDFESGNQLTRRRHVMVDEPIAALMRTLCEGDTAALHRYVLRLNGGNHARAEDVVQETLLRAWQHLEIVADSERPARAWLFTVARNITIDEYRTPRYRREVRSLEDDGVPETTIADNANAVLDRLLIDNALAELSAEHLGVLHRAYYLGWSIAEIAENLQIAEGTVKSRMHYGLRALRVILEEMGVNR